MNDHLKTLSWFSIALLTIQCVFVSILQHANSHRLSEPSNWVIALFLLVSLLATCLALARELPLQNVIAAAGIIGFVSWVLISLGHGSIKGLASSWRFAIFAVLAILNSRGIARLVLVRWRQRSDYGIWLLALAVLISSLSLFFWQSLMVRSHSFLYAVSVPALAIHAVVASIAGLFFSAPFLINKKPIEHPPTLEPLIIWLLLSLTLCSTALKSRQHTGVELGLVPSHILLPLQFSVALCSICHSITPPLHLCIHPACLTVCAAELDSALCNTLLDFLKWLMRQRLK